MCEAVKRLNALKHQKNTREKKLELLQTEYNQLVTDAEEVSSTDAGESAEAQVLNKNYYHSVLVPRATCPGAYAQETSCSGDTCFDWLE